MIVGEGCAICERTETIMKQVAERLEIEDKTIDVKKLNVYI